MEVVTQAIATSNPPLYVTQKEAFEFYDSHFALSPAQKDLYRRLLLDGPIRGRHIGMDRKEEACETDPDRLNARFLKFARLTAAQAARRALRKAHRRAAEVGGIVVNTCTGYLCPGLSSYLSEDLRLPSAAKAVDISGMGCAGALPNLECAAALVRSGCRGPVLSIAVEVCTATMFMADDPALTVSNSIFGDGAAACVLTSRDAANGRAAFRLLDFESGMFPKYREQLRYRSDGGRLRNVLTRRVPVIGARCAGIVLDRLLARNRLAIASIPWWSVHAGGTAVLKRVGAVLGLTDDQLRFSNEVFRDCGNMSSPSVLFALQRLIEKGRPAAGEKGILLAFGAGFSAFAGLVEFCGASEP